MEAIASKTVTQVQKQGSPAIEVKQLRKMFKDFVAVDSLTLSVERGEIYGLLGPNGSGKTTTINMISGLSKPTAGSITVFGQDIVHDPRSVRKLLGSIPQETALYEELTAWQNMVFHAELYNVPRREREERITALLNLVELYDRRNSLSGTFSGGMKRRLAFARALLHQPELVYMDEPTLGVDVQSRHALWNYTRDLKKQGKTVLLTTNYLEEANELCDRIAIIDHGKLLALDTPTRLKQTYGGTVIDLETDKPLSAATLEKLKHLPGVSQFRQDGVALSMTVSGEQSVMADAISLVTAEARLTTITQREPSLNEVFIAITGSQLRD